MSSIDGIRDFSPSVGSLKKGNKADSEKSAPVRRFSVQDLKNGGSMDFSGALESKNIETSGTIRDKYRGKGPAPSARQSHNSNLSEDEKIEKLAKIRKSAIEYEAFFVDHLVKQMRSSPMAKTPGGDTLNDIAEQPFRDFLSQAGGMGLADTIVGQIASQEGLEETLASNPHIMGPNWKAKIPPNLMKKEPRGLSMPPNMPTDEESKGPQEHLSKENE